MKKYISFLLAAVMSLGVVGCSTVKKENKTTEEKREIITVGFDQNFPPMGFVGEGGEFTGFDLELAAEAAKRLNMELKLQPIAWDAKDMELETKNVDCIWNGFTISGRKEKYTWTRPYMANNQVFLVKKGSDIKKMEDLKDKIVAVQADSSAEEALKSREDLRETFKEYIKTADYNTALMDLESGAVDAVAMDSIVAAYQNEKRDGKFEMIEESLASEEYGVGFLLGNSELRDKVQKVLDEMIDDGKFQEISMKWFGRDVSQSIQKK